MTQNHLHSYQAHAFHPQFPNGRMAGSLQWELTEVYFIWEGGRTTIPISGLHLALGGANNRLVLLEHPSLSEWSFYTSDHAILEDSNLLDHVELAEAVKGLKRQRAKQWVAPVLVLGLLIALIVGIFAAKPWMVDGLSAQVPASWEEKLGDTVFAQYSLNADMVVDSQLEIHMKTLTQALTEYLPDKRYEFKFHVVNDPTLNAFAFPGGHVVFHSGAIRKADAVEELLGVLAHEIAHVNRRHSLKSMINSVGLVLLAQMLIGDSTALFAILNEAAPYLLNQQFSRDNERDADITGLHYLDLAGIDPNGMKGFFQKIQEAQGAAGAVDEKLNFLSTHPSTGERIERIQDHIATMEKREFREFGTLLDDLKTSLDAALASGETEETREDGNNENTH